ncbi:hypothetical protein H7Y29_03850 [Microbacteriaceae bacterium]|nr:hypothetical protein [Candidatus Saccharibacteria bacterium]
MILEVLKLHLINLGGMLLSNARHIEGSSTTHHTTLELASASVPSLMTAGISLASLIDNRDMRLGRPHGRLVRAMEIVQIASAAMTVTSRGIALYKRHKGGMGLLERHSTESHTRVMVTTLFVAAPIASAFQLHQIRGTTLFRKHNVTGIGKAEATAEFVQTTIVASLAGAELYKTRALWLPKVKHRVAQAQPRLQTGLALITRKRKRAEAIVDAGPAVVDDDAEVLARRLMKEFE